MSEHPGQILREYFLEPLGITMYRLSKETGLTGPHVHAIVNGTRAVTAATALRLGRYFGVPADFWMGIQVKYDLHFTQEKIKVDLDKIVPLKPMETTERVG